MKIDQAVFDNTEAILKSVCGTAHTGQANSCDHDHSGQARGLVTAIYESVEGDVRVDTGAVTLSADTIESLLNCTDAAATDEREPQRYRERYVEAAAQLRVAAGVKDGETRRK